MTQWADNRYFRFLLALMKQAQRTQDEFQSSLSKGRSHHWQSPLLDHYDAFLLVYRL